MDKHSYPVMKVTIVGQLILLALVACNAHYLDVSNSIPLLANETDRLSLLQFKDAISLDPHQVFMSWNDTTHFCNWEGVLCRLKTPPHRVTSLNLTSGGLVGRISPSLGNLSFLHVLDLTKNTLTGEIPPFPLVTCVASEPSTWGITHYKEGYPIFQTARTLGCSVFQLTI